MSVTRALVIVDIQNDYFPGGRCELVGPEAAAANAGRLLANQRAAGLPVFHIQHVRAMTPSTSLPERRASRSTTRCGRSRESRWCDTDLEQRLREAGAEELLVVGMMTSMCVDATVRAAVDLGFGCTVAYDACATLDLEFAGATIPAVEVHGAFMAALGDGYANVVSSDDV